MYQKYEMAVALAEDKIIKLGYSKTILRTFRACTKRLRCEMEKRGVCYSLAITEDHLRTIEKEYAHDYFLIIKGCHRHVALAYYGRTYFDKGFFSTKENRYDQLPQWAKTTLDDFISKERISIPTIGQYRQPLITFLLYLCSKDVKSANEITCNLLVPYVKSNRSGTQGIRNLILYLERCGICKCYTSFCCNRVYASRVVKIELIGKQGNCRSFDIIQYRSAQEALEQYSYATGYPKKFREKQTSVMNEFGLFLVFNGLDYTEEVGEEYLKYRSIHFQQSPANTVRRVLLLISEYFRNGCFDGAPPMYPRRETQTRLPRWIEEHATEFLRERESNHMSESTLQMDYHAILRFASFLDGKGCRSVTDITIPLIKEFNKNDGHATMEGKQAYNSRIRGFLRFLGRDGLVFDCLSLAVPDTVAGRIRPARILDDDQFDRIMAYCHNPDTRLLDSAILLTALETGLRVSDIIGLRFQDIDWDDTAFSIVQRKTGVHIRIPFTNGVGNAIWRYLREERPDIPDDHVFLYPRAPFRPVGRSIVGVCLDRALKTHVGGGHITRKTFASRLLRKECPVPMISDLLGHRDDSSIDTYLDTDTSMMRRCSLPLGKTCSYEGGLL